MAKTKEIQLGDRTRLTILYEDRAVLAIDKPPGWMLAPVGWDRTGRNLQRALESCLRGGDFWVRSRNLKFLRFVHRLDADTSGVLLLAKTPGALRAFSRLFESRLMEKLYLAVVQGRPARQGWTCALPVGAEPNRPGRMQVKGREAKPALTRFTLLETGQGRSLVLARPETGRTHQIRVHLAAAGHPVVGDRLYGGAPVGESVDALALRAVGLAYRDPFLRKRVMIEAPSLRFLDQYGFAGPAGAWPWQRLAEAEAGAFQQGHQAPQPGPLPIRWGEGGQQAG